MASRSGELAMRPLPAVLLDLHDDFATGKLMLKRGRVSKTVDLVDGNPVSTASSPRDETLGHFLVNSGVIDEDQHREAVARAAQLGGKVGEALVALHVLTADQVADQLGRQARHKVVQALRWPQGAWRFDDSGPTEGVRLHMVEVVLHGLRETAVEDLDRLARLDGQRFQLTARGTRLRRHLERVFGRAAGLLTEGASIEALEQAFDDRMQARLAIDSMILCDAVEAVVDTHYGLGSVSGKIPDPEDDDEEDDDDPAGAPLFDILFDDIGYTKDGAVPIELGEGDGDDDDSGVVSTADVDAAVEARNRATAAGQLLTAEHQRVTNADHYAVLMVGRRAQMTEIEAAFEIRSGLLSQHESALRDPRDRERVEELREAYDAARFALTDDRVRAAYDRELAGGEAAEVPPGLDTELTFRMAEELLQKGEWEPAIGLLHQVIEQSPTQADFHAALGWAEWMAGGELPESADLARTHLNSALEINPDHAASHDYKGRINVALRSDDAEAMFHLERAIDLDPSRHEALAAIEVLLFARGELRRYERTLKRLLFRLRGRGSTGETDAWVRLARLYLDHLDDPHAASIAATNAQRVAPDDPGVIAIVARASARVASAEPVHTGWRDALQDPSSGAAVVRSAEASGHADAAFLAAATMVAIGTADPVMAGLYDRDRVRGIVVPTSPLGRDQWAMLRHKDDAVELGGLIELVAPAVHAVAPMTLADSELEPNQRISDDELPPSFLRMRERCAALLGVPVPAVFPRVELGSQIHVLATDPPVLVAGDEALTAPERPQLVFSMVRAMTFLWPGRAVGGSRPGRILRAVVMAVFREASGTTVGTEDPFASAAADAVAQLSSQARVQARAAALRLLSRGAGLNLSLWARSLSRTADRAGMLLCGDIPAAFAGAREVGDLDRDLVDFAFSAAHVRLRLQLGIAHG